MQVPACKVRLGMQEVHVAVPLAAPRVKSHVVQPIGQVHFCMLAPREQA
jgi:hypothetical protein